jgi:hypothetical protein
MTPVISGTRSRSLASSKDPDQELFEFLNNADVPDPKSDSVAIRFESRSPSASSSISARSRKTPEGSSTESAVNLSLISKSFCQDIVFDNHLCLRVSWLQCHSCHLESGTPVGRLVLWFRICTLVHR